MTSSPCPRAPLAVALVALIALAGAATSEAAPRRADFTVQVRLAGDDAAVDAERVVVRREDAMMTVVAEATDITGEVTFDLEVDERTSYVVSAWVDGVAYHARHAGREVVAGDPAVVYAFATTDGTDGVTVTGLNVVVRRREGGFEYELIAQVDNQSRPQRTVRAAALPLKVALPAGVDRFAAEVDAGPVTRAVELQPAGDLTGVAVALPPGTARVTISGVALTGDELTFDVASNLPVAGWSLLTWPSDLEVRSADVLEDGDLDAAGFGRWRGEALPAGRRVEIAVAATSPAVATQVFDAEAPRPEPRPRSDRQDRGFPWVTVIVAAVLLGAFALWRARR